jgi:hypothetical protein
LDPLTLIDRRIHLMADQGAVRDGAAADDSGNGSHLHDGVAEFLDDAVTLAELQVKLASLNLEEAAWKATGPIGLVALGLTVFAASLIVALTGVGLQLAAALNIHQGSALILTARVAVAVAGLLVPFEVRRLRSSLDSLRRSREELKRNLTWLQTVLHAHGFRRRRRNG